MACISSGFSLKLGQLWYQRLLRVGNDFVDSHVNDGYQTWPSFAVPHVLTLGTLS